MANTPEPRPLGPLSSRAIQHMVAMRDSVRLATDVHLPEGDGPFPTVLTRLPYDKCDPDNQIEYVARAVTSRGYAFVAQDTRGRARSEGDPWPFMCEKSDGYDTMEWLTEQPWCDGRVAMWGVSYFGFTQWAATASAHPALRAIIPVTTSSDVESWMWRQGVFNLGLAAVWSAAIWTDERYYGFEAELDWSHRPLRDVLAHQFGGRDSEAFHAMGAHGPASSFWTEDVYGGQSPARGLAVPALHVGGWWDVFQRGQIADWALASATSAAPQRLVMDCVDHYIAEWAEEGHDMLDLSQVPVAQLESWSVESMAGPLDFLDEVILGKTSSPVAPVKWRLTHGEWRTAQTWPPPGVEQRKVFLARADEASDAALTFDCPPEATWASWDHDPNHLVPTMGMAHTLTELMMPPDDSVLETRDDILVLTTSPFEAPIDLVGQILANLQVGSTDPEMHVIVRLLDVYPDGRTRRIRDGAALVREARSDPHVRVDLGQAAYRMRTGHRLRLHVASSDFPRYLPLFGEGIDPWTATVGTPSTSRIRLGGDHASHLTLGVLKP